MIRMQQFFFLPGLDEVKVGPGFGGRGVLLFDELARDPDQLANSERGLQRRPGRRNEATITRTI